MLHQDLARAQLSLYQCVLPCRLQPVLGSDTLLLTQAEAGPLQACDTASAGGRELLLGCQ